MSEAYPPYVRAADEGRAYAEAGAGGDLFLAPIMRRAGARLIDAGLLGVVGFALILPFMIAAYGLDRPATSVKETGGVWSGVSIFGWVLVLGIVPFAYEAVQLALWGQTLGKRVLGLRVLDETGAPLTPARAVGRAAVNNLAYLFGCGVGTVMAYLWAVWDQPLHQALHDRLAATVVVDDRDYDDPASEGRAYDEPAYHDRAYDDRRYDDRGYAYE